LLLEQSCSFTYNSGKESIMVIVGGVRMDLPIMVGAGVCKTPRSTREYMHPDLPLGAVVTGSYTPEPREGNTGDLFAWTDKEEGFALNAYGMPNCGYKEAHYQLSLFPLTRPLVVSVAGFSPEDYKEGLNTFATGAPFVSAVELNLGCPNAHDKKTVPIANDFESMAELFKLCSNVACTVPVWVKLSPYLTERDVESIPQYIDTSFVPRVAEGYASSVAKLIASYSDFIKAVVTTNTIGNCIYRRNGVLVTTPNDGKAGLSGPLMKKYSMWQTSFFRASLPRAFDVIASGGVMNGDDIADYLGINATAVQCTTLPYQFGGPKVFSQLIAESERLQRHLGL
jgi:dihydroorotate dehydrogenase